MTATGPGRTPTRGRGPGTGRRRGLLVLASPQARLRTALLALVFVLSLFGARLFQLQVADAAGNAARAADVNTRHQVIRAARGDITDAQGRPLATTVAAYLVAADPKLTAPFADRLAAALAGPLGTTPDALAAKLRPPASNPGLRYVVLARQVDPAARAAVDSAVSAVRAQLQAADRAAHRTLSVVGGIVVTDDPRRVYPAGPVAGNVVGFLGSAIGDDTPVRIGLEATANTLLSGRNGERSFQTGLGEAIPTAEQTTPAVDGTSIRLTLDSDIQWKVQQSLDAGVADTGSEYGMAVVTEVGTGRVVALAASPGFDPTQPGSLPAADRGDPPLERVYEPGSVEKILTMASLLDTGKITPSTPITVPDRVRIGSDVIHDDVTHADWHLTAAGVLAKSSNVGTVRLASLLGKQQLETYLRSFGLGSRTGVLPGASESRGLLAPSSRWKAVTTANIAFGQGVAVTAVQMAAAVSTIANGGVYVPPTLVAGTTTPDGVHHPGAAPTTHRVVSADAATAVTEMMLGVTGPDGTAPRGGIPGFPVAGKTGTAQYSGAGISYADGIHTVSFAGWAPATAPRYTTYVVLHAPKTKRSGATAAAPVWKDIETYLLARFPPSSTGAVLTAPPVWQGKRGE